MTHILIVSKTDDPDRVEYNIECPGITDECRMWQECPAGVDDIAALDALEDEGDDEPVVHGLRHRRIAGDWMAETDRCYVEGHDSIPDEAAGRFGPGRHSISWDVGDGTELFIDEAAEAVSV